MTGVVRAGGAAGESVLAARCAGAGGPMTGAVAAAGFMLVASRVGAVMAR
ncbi:hypothetical protein [Flindersiella endophytica]